MKKYLVVIILAVFTSTCAVQSGEPEQLTEQVALQEIVQLQRKLAISVKRKDWAVYQSVLLDNYTLILPSGNVMDGPTFINALKNDEIELNWIEFDELGIKLLHDTAIVTGRFSIEGKLPEGKIKGSYRGVGIFEKRGNDWSFAYQQLGPRISESIVNE